MKNSIIYSILLASVAGIVLSSCQEDYSRVHYPQSVPVFQQAVVEETKITYGDSITVNVEVSDQMPLSTLEMMIVVNDQIISKASVRTAGNSASCSRKFHVPFGPYMPDNTSVEVHLSSINVEGFHKDTVLMATIVTRPAIPTMYLVSGTRYVELKLTDPGNYIYSADNLTFGNELTFLLPTKITRFGRVDWTAMVFGDVKGELGIVGQGGDSVKIADLSIVGIKSVKLDLFNFTVTATGDPLQPATGINVATFSSVNIVSTDHLGTQTTESWKRTQLYLGNNVEITFSGIGNPANGLSPDFFEVTGANTARFLGETGVYTLYYLPSADYLYVEQPNSKFPNALWLCGVGFGRPAAPYAKTSSWNWNSPLEYVYCRKLSPGVFQATIYAKAETSSDTENAWRYAFSSKFFYQRGWGDDGTEKEIDGRKYTISSNLIYAPTDKDQGNFVGTERLVSAPGVYRFTINTNTQTVTFETVN